jgi:hypothetical protein
MIIKGAIFMKFKDKFPNAKHMEMADKGHLVGMEKGCLMCGEPTKFIEVCSEAHFCSEECEDIFYKMMNEELEDLDKLE